VADEHAVVGRHRELAAIEAFVASISNGPTALVIEGDVGIGKTTLFRAGLEAASERGARVLVGRPIQSEAQFAYAALGDLLGSVPEAVLDELPPPQRKAIDVALLRAEPDEEQELLPRAVALGLLGALRALAQRGPTIVAIDDVQWLDKPSESALAFVSRRLGDEAIGILAARRTEGQPSACLFGLEGETAFSGTQLRHVPIEPLGEADVDRLVRERIGRTLPRHVVGRIHQMSGGNPFFALEIARSGLHESVPALADPVPVPPSLQQLVGHRITSLPSHAREAANVVAVLSRSTVSVVEAAMDGDDRAAGIAAAIDAGVLDRSGEQLTFTHPLLQSVAYAQIPPDERRRLHSRVGVLLLDPEERGRHFGLAAEEPGDLVALALDWAARRARARGAPDAAAELLEQARRLTPASAPSDAQRRGIAAAERHFEAGNTPRADALLTELVETAPSPRDRALALARLGWVRAHSQGLHSAEQLFRAALAEHSDEDALRVEIEQGLAWSVHSTKSGTEALVHGRIAYRLAEQLGDASLIAGALSHLAILLSLSGNGIALAEIERASELGHTPSWSQILGRTDWVHALLLQWAGRLEQAGRCFVDLLERADAQCDEHALPAIMFQLAGNELLMGDWRAAERHARECIDATIRSGQVGERPYALTAAANVDAHLGNVEAARRAIAEVCRLSEDLGVQPAGLEALVVKGFLELSLGDHADAAATHAALEKASARAGFGEPAHLRYRGDAIEALLALGRREEAAERVAELEDLAARATNPWVRMVALRCRGLLDAASGDLAVAQEHLQASLAVECEGELFERARTLLALGTVQRRDKQKRAARASLSEALDVFGRLGAALWLDRAQAELDRVGGRVADDDALTVTERRVATLIAAGRTYREAADELFISPKTVQWNLSKVYRKLGIRSRAELPARLAELDHDG
jgi:DNA-binding CsgD family transcriptional regulator